MTVASERVRRCSQDDSAVPLLLLAPYLPSTAGVIGPWTFVPFGRVADSAALPTVLRERTLRLIEAYKPAASVILGSVVYPTGGQIGSEFDVATIRRLRHSLLAGAVAENPPLAVPKDEQMANAGHAAMTSENTLLYGHGLESSTSYVIGVGEIVHTTTAYYAPEGEPLPKVTPPPELPTPLFASFDQELAQATHAVLDPACETGRRLDRCLDWCQLALSNAEAVSRDVRVGAVRSALEALTGKTNTTKLVRAIGRLLDGDTTPRRTHTSHFWRGPVQLSPVEWWLVHLTELRNAIVHGNPITDDMWLHEGQHHLAIAHDTLIRCLKATVATEAEDSALRKSLRDRGIERATGEALEFLRQQNSASGPPVSD